MADLGDWEARQRRFVAELDQKSRSVRAAVEGIRVRMPSHNGELGVIVDAQGRVVDIRLTPQALRLGDAGLARLLVETIRRAEEAAAHRVAEAIAPLTKDPVVAETLSASRGLLERMGE